MLRQLNYKENRSVGQTRGASKKAAFYLRLLFAAAVFFIVFVIASDQRERSNLVKITNDNNSGIASSSQTPPRPVKLTIFNGASNDIFKFLLPTAQAQGVDTLRTSGLDNTAGLDNISNINLPQTDIRVFIARLINIALSFLGIILLGLVVYGGWLWMTSEGEPEKINQAKAIFKNAAIGLIIILSAFAIVNFVLRALLGGGGGGGGRPEPQYDVGVAALGDGIIESHYPARGQTDVPRNTIIIITFKEELNPNTICDISQNTDLAKCDGDDLRTGNIAIFPTVNGAELNEDADDAANSSKVVPAKVSSNDNKTFIFRPDQFLGSQNQEQWYGVRLNEDNLQKKNGDDVDLGIQNYYQWKFQVSTRLDLTPPQVQSVFPQPDNQADTRITANTARQAAWTITVNSAPNYYRASSAQIASGSDIDAVDAELVGQYQNCRGSDRVQFLVGTAGTSQQLALVLQGTTNIQTLTGESVIVNQVANIGCGLTVQFKVDPTTLSRRELKIAVEEGQSGDKITVAGREYTFGREINSNNALAANIANAFRDNETVSASVRGQVVTLTAKTDRFPGRAGNDLEITTSNSTALNIQHTPGQDRQEGYTTQDRPDEPRNAIIQINFNEAMNPIQLQGEANSEIKNYLKVQCVPSPSYNCTGEGIIDDAGVKYLDGIFSISNIYKTVEFKTKTECGQNSCGEAMYCLPPLANVKVWVKAASLTSCSSDEACSQTAGTQLNFGTCSGNATTPGVCQQQANNQTINYPQASIPPNGAMDAASNSLDGNRNNNAEGSRSDFNENSPESLEYTTGILFGDNFTWSFWTSDKIDLASPVIESVKSGALDLVSVENNAGRQVTGAGVREPVKISFNKLMSSSSLKPGRNYPNDYYFNPDPAAPKVQREYFIFMNFSSVPLGYWVSKMDSDASTPLDGFADKTAAVIDHTILSDNGAYSFVAGSGAKDIYQNCYNPAKDSGAGGSQCNGDTMGPGDSCCKGIIKIEGGQGEKCYKF